MAKETRKKSKRPHGALQTLTNGSLLSVGPTLAIPLFFIPYVTRSTEMCMASFARFAAGSFPFYLVLGNMLARTRAPLAAVLVGLSGFLLGVYAAMFAVWYRFF